MKNLTWQNPEQLFVAQELINKVKSKCCGIKDKEKIADETILKAVKLLTKERNSIWGVDTMNAYVHSNKLSPVPIDIQTTWDNIQDFMVTLWSQIESE